MALHTEQHLAKSLRAISNLWKILEDKDDTISKAYERQRRIKDFLIRFVEAADSHVELADLVDEGRQLIKELGI